MFDPKKHGGGSGGGDAEVLAAGEYLVAMVWLKRAQGRNGDYLRAKYQVCAGPHAGKTFFANVGLNVENEGTAGRLSVYCTCIGQTEAFDLKSDRSLQKVFLGKPFKARVKVEKNGQYTNNDIERYVPKVSAVEQEQMRGWVLDQAEQRSADGKGSDDFDDAPPPGDDDIPF